MVKGRHNGMRFHAWGLKYHDKRRRACAIRITMTAKNDHRHRWMSWSSELYNQSYAVLGVALPVKTNHGGSWSAIALRTNAIGETVHSRFYKYHTLYQWEPCAVVRGLFFHRPDRTKHYFNKDRDRAGSVR